MSTPLREPPAGRALVESAVARSEHVAAVSVAAGALERAPALLTTQFDASSVLLVADDNTMSAAGTALGRHCTEAGLSVEEMVFPGQPRLEDRLEHGEAIRQRIGRRDALPVAVGSGVINDLVKYGAFRAERRYACVATAASMDGYASAGAPLLDKGFKHTIPCAPPRVVVADLEVIGNAPPAMNAWGYGDLAGKLPAGADWLIADALGIESIDDVAWPLVQDNLRGWLAQPQALVRGEPPATAALLTGLVLSGLAMEFYGSSRPASGADHQIAHLWEMDHVRDGDEPAAHGALVGVGTLAVLALQHWLCERDLDTLDVARIVARRPAFEAVRERIGRAFDDEIAARATAETRAKYVEGAALRERLSRFLALWPQLRARLEGFLMPVDEMRASLGAAGAVTDPVAYGIDPGYLRDSIRNALYLRRRYTVLDILDELALLDEAIAATTGI